MGLAQGAGTDGPLQEAAPAASRVPGVADAGLVGGAGRAAGGCVRRGEVPEVRVGRAAEAAEQHEGDEEQGRGVQVPSRGPLALVYNML